MFFYMSFADPKRAEGEQFLGCTIIEAEDEHAAMRKSWRLGINPGGEVKFAGFDEIPADVRDMVDRFVPRLEGLERGKNWK